MNIGSSPSQASPSFTGSIDMQRTAFQMQQTLTGPDGEATRTIMVDAVEVNIHIDGEFARRVLQNSMADQLNAAFAAAGMAPRSIACCRAVRIFRRRPPHSGSSIFRRVSLARLSKTTPTRPDNPRPPILQR